MRMIHTRIIAKYALLFFCLVLTASCERLGQVEKSDKSEVATDKSNSDELQYPLRVVTLAPHLTELLYSLGYGDKIIATVDYSDYPEAANAIPRIGNAFQIDWERLVALQPDLVLGWEGGNPEAVLVQIENLGLKLARFKNAKLMQLPDQLNKLARLLGSKQTHERLIHQYRSRLSQLQQQYRDKPRVKVFYQVSTAPIFSVDASHTISDMLRICGAENVLQKTLVGTGAVTTEAVLAMQPDIILTGAGMHTEVEAAWNGVFPAENIVSIPADEVTRASLRMAIGTENICKAIDAWRQLPYRDR